MLLKAWNTFLSKDLQNYKELKEIRNNFLGPS